MKQAEHLGARSRRPPAARSGTYVQIYPSDLVNASRMLKVATSLHDAGLFDEAHLVGVRSGELPETETVADGVRIVRIGGSRRGGAVGQLLRAALWQPKVFARYRGRRIAAVAAHNVWVLPLAWSLSRYGRAPLIYNAHELETETSGRRGLKKRAAKLVESRLIRKCAVVSVVNDSISDWYEREYTIERPVAVRNVPVARHESVGLRERLGVSPDDMLYVHTGHLTIGRNIPLVLETFAKSAHHVVFIGNGPLQPDVTAAAAASPNIHWLPSVSHDLVVAHVREADAGLCLIEVQMDLSYRLATPNKLLEALVAGTPALCSDMVEARRLLGDLAADWVLADPTHDLAAALERIGKGDVERFRARWRTELTWDDEVAPLIAAYRCALDERA
jgi:glycosyltransferase involved in cell wall biosynthesis